MSQSNPAILVGAVIAVGALGVLFWSGQSAEPSPDTVLEARVASLEQEVATLKMELERRRERGQRRGAARGDGSRLGRAAGATLDDESLAREIARKARVGGPPGEEAQGAVLDVLDSDDPQVRERLDALVRDSLEEEREQRMERRRERAEQRAAERLDQLANDANLTRAQVDELDAALAQEREEIFAIFRAAREDGSWNEARQKAGEIRTGTDEKVAELLSEGQLDAWNAMREEDAQRRGR